MTWRDELLALDQKLAAGTISAEEYHRTRDALLAASQSQSAAPSAQQPYGQWSPQGRPARPVSPGTPVPPGTWGQPPAAGATPTAGDSTQFFGPAGPPTGAEANRTQMIRVGDDADRTQVIPRQSIGGQPPSGPGSWAPQAQWSNADDYSAPGPPWGGSDFEPIVPPGDPWVRQGTEAFEKGPSGKGHILGIVVIVVLVIGLATAGTVYSLNNGSNTVQSSPTQQSTAGTTAARTTTVALPEPPPKRSPPADSKHALIDPPGTARAGGGSFDLAALRTNHLFSQPMVDALTKAGMKNGLLKTTTDDGVTVGLYALTVQSESAAANVAQVYGTIQREGGLPGNHQLSMVGVPVFSTSTDARNPVYRTVYVLYDRAIILEAFESPQARQVFAGLLQQQVNLAPPTVRAF